jgi:predicted RNA binding protein YcfA (HicA-like mRNA interferase family)
MSKRVECVGDFSDYVFNTGKTQYTIKGSEVNKFSGHNIDIGEIEDYLRRSPVRRSGIVGIPLADRKVQISCQVSKGKCQINGVQFSPIEETTTGTPPPMGPQVSRRVITALLDILDQANGSRERCAKVVKLFSNLAEALGLPVTTNGSHMTIHSLREGVITVAFHSGRNISVGEIRRYIQWLLKLISGEVHHSASKPTLRVPVLPIHSDGPVPLATIADFRNAAIEQNENCFFASMAYFLGETPEDVRIATGANATEFGGDNVGGARNYAMVVAQRYGKRVFIVDIAEHNYRIFPDRTRYYDTYGIVHFITPAEMAHQITTEDIVLCYSGVGGQDSSIGWHVDALVLRHKLPQLQTAGENPEPSFQPQATIKGPARFTSDDYHFLSTLANPDDEVSLTALMMLRFMISGYSKKQRDPFLSHILLDLRLSGLEIFGLSTAFNYFTPVELNYEYIIERMQREYAKSIGGGNIFFPESSSGTQEEDARALELSLAIQEELGRFSEYDQDMFLVRMSMAISAYVGFSICSGANPESFQIPMFTQHPIDRLMELEKIIDLERLIEAMRGASSLSEINPYRFMVVKLDPTTFTRGIDHTGWVHLGYEDIFRIERIRRKIPSLDPFLAQLARSQNCPKGHIREIDYKKLETEANRIARLNKRHQAYEVLRLKVDDFMGFREFQPGNPSLMEIFYSTNFGNFRIREVASNGNCLFTAIGLFTGQDQATVRQTINATARRILANRAAFPAITIDDENFAVVINDTNANAIRCNRWGHVETNAIVAAITYGRRVFVLHQGNQGMADYIDARFALGFDIFGNPLDLGIERPQQGDIVLFDRTNTGNAHVDALEIVFPGSPEQPGGTGETSVVPAVIPVSDVVFPSLGSMELSGICKYRIVEIPNDWNCPYRAIAKCINLSVQSGHMVVEKTARAANGINPSMPPGYATRRITQADIRRKMKETKAQLYGWHVEATRNAQLEAITGFAIRAATRCSARVFVLVRDYRNVDRHEINLDETFLCFPGRYGSDIKRRLTQQEMIAKVNEPEFKVILYFRVDPRDNPIERRVDLIMLEK